MSAQLQGAAGGAPRANHFNAHLALAGDVTVNINAPSMATLAAVVGKLQPVESAANDAPNAPAATNPAPAKVAETKEQPAGNASASTGTQASDPAAASGSAPAGDAARPTYDDVKARVLALSKKNRQLAVDTLGQFKTVKGEKVDHGNKLQLEDYPAFIAAADKVLGA